VFNFLDIHEANAGNPLFCHVAFAPEEDLVVEQNNGLHCNKTIVGARIGQVQMEYGLSVSDLHLSVS